MAKDGSRRSLLIAAIGIVGVALVVWWLRGPGSSPEEVPALGAPTSVPTAGRSAPASGAGGPNTGAGGPLAASPGRAPAQRITDQGRLSVSLEALREGDVYAVGLEMPDASRGEGLATVVVVDVAGRRLETTAAPVEGRDAGLRLEIAPDWLEPGRYMIQVETGEFPLPIRRYVLEVD